RVARRHALRPTGSRSLPRTGPRQSSAYPSQQTFVDVASQPFHALLVAMVVRVDLHQSFNRFVSFLKILAVKYTSNSLISTSKYCVSRFSSLYREAQNSMTNCEFGCFAPIASNCAA